MVDPNPTFTGRGTSIHYLVARPEPGYTSRRNLGFDENFLGAVTSRRFNG